MATNRMPKTELDPIWMSALGFALVSDTRISFLQWKHEKLGFQLRDTDSHGTVVSRYTHYVERRAIESQQAALRQVLLPAMGLEEHSEHDEYGSETRHYIRSEK